MSLKIGRQGLLGIGIENVPGTPVPATAVIPFISNNLQGKHEPIDDIASRGSRAKDFSSVPGKKWSEGDLEVNVDSLSLGFMLKMGLGNEIVNTIQTGVYDHLFYTTTSGNTPTTATFYTYQGVDTQLFPSVAVDMIDIEVKDELMTAKVGLKGLPPTNGSFTQTTASGTLFSFTNYSIKLGNTLPLAVASSAIPVTEFTLSIKNNAEVIFESGQGNASRIAWKEFEVTGTFTRFFESTADRDNYLNLNKQSLVLTASGMALPGGYNEGLTINLAKLAYKDSSIETGLENFFAIQTTFTAEVDPSQGKQLDVILRNYRQSAYS